MENVFTGRDESSAMSATTVLESSPPLRKAPSGTSLIIRRLTAWRSSWVACSVASASPGGHGDQPGRPAVPERAREHPVEPREGLEPFVDVERKEHFRIRPGAEHVAPLLELGFQLRVVVDLAVVADAHLAVRRLHRLLAARQVDDAQPPVRECHGSALVESLLVRTPMAQDFGHPMQALAGRSTSRIELENAADSAHGQLPPSWKHIHHSPSSRETSALPRWTASTSSRLDGEWWMCFQDGGS